jgi:hypothetical protein
MLGGVHEQIFREDHTCENSAQAKLAMVLTEISSTQQVPLKSPHADDGQTRARPLPLLLLARLLCRRSIEAGWRPIGRLCALHCASPAKGLAKGRCRLRATLLRRHRPVGAHRGVGSIRANRTLPNVPSRTPPMWMHRGLGTIMGRARASMGSPRALSSVPWRACALRLPTSTTWRPSAPRTGVARHPGVSPIRF